MTKEKHTGVIYGRNPVLEWIDSGLGIKVMYVSRDAGQKPVRDILQFCDQKSVPVQRVTPHDISQIAGTHKHQNVAARVELPGYAELDELFIRADNRAEAPLIVILDGITDPHNLGAILRTADAAGVHGVIIPKDKAAGLTPSAVKASAGAAAYCPVVQVTNIVRTIKELKQRRLWITGLDQEGEQTFEHIDWCGPSALVMGSEGRGIRRLVRDSCDFFASIPMHGHINSLNVSVAAALCMFEARRQRIRLNT